MFAFKIGEIANPLPSLNPLGHEDKGRIPRKGGGIKFKTFSSRANYCQPVNPLEVGPTPSGENDCGGGIYFGMILKT